MRADLRKIYAKLNPKGFNQEDVMSDRIGALNRDFRSVVDDYDPSDDLSVFFDPAVGLIKLRPFSQGVVNNSNLFGPHELVIFHRYQNWVNRAKLLHGDTLKIKFIDIGANVGLHSIVVARLAAPSVSIVCIEPMDEVTLVREDNFSLNGVSKFQNVCGAVVPQAFDGESVLFKKCHENFTASTTSLSGKSIYGETSEFHVQALRPSLLLSHFVLGDPVQLLLIKIDIEGSEADLIHDLLPHLLALREEVSVRVALEVSSEENAARIFKLLSQVDQRVLAYSDLTADLLRISRVSDIPTNWAQGSLYIEL